MPNGKPGDNPFTDIIVWRHPVFGDEIDDKVRSVDAIATTTFKDLLATFLIMWPCEKGVPTAPRSLSKILDAMLQYAEIQRRLNDQG
jgi:hypothetical protein